MVEQSGHRRLGDWSALYLRSLGLAPTDVALLRMESLEQAKLFDLVRRYLLLTIQPDSNRSTGA